MILPADWRCLLGLESLAVAQFTRRGGHPLWQVFRFQYFSFSDFSRRPG